MTRRIAIFALVIGAMVAGPVGLYLRERISPTGSLPPGVMPVDLKALTRFEFDQQSGTDADVPERFRKLDGKQVALEGELSQPVMDGSRMVAVDLLWTLNRRSDFEPPRIQEFVAVSVPPHLDVRFCDGLVRAIGTLHVQVERGDGKVTRVFRLELSRLDKL